ncbi:hypothetical protein FBU59_003424 [Linderina macrospora]|uniref:Uncharacterized protein n=1 Tax=Linderina macrospora TaxID=4868 RepID=A0ACC1J8I5_9FUNG|nr:hypothetical protein FBU59_003424 [Linderina macrospora]
MPSHLLFPESPKRTSGGKKFKAPRYIAKRSIISPDIYQPECLFGDCGRFYQGAVEMPGIAEGYKPSGGSRNVRIKPIKTPKKSKPAKSKRAFIKPDILPQECSYTGCNGYERNPSIWEAINAPERRHKNQGEKKPGKKSGKKSTNQRGGEIDYDDVDSSYNQRAMYEGDDDDEYNQRIGRTLGMIFGRLINRGLVGNM